MYQENPQDNYMTEQAPYFCDLIVKAMLDRKISFLQKKQLKQGLISILNTDTSNPSIIFKK